MKPSVESLALHRLIAPAAGAREGILDVPGNVRLHHGGVLSSVRIAWRLIGPAGAPVVAALGGISAHRHVASDSQGEGWWREVVGPALALDTERFRILSFDYLGGRGDTLCSAATEELPPISTFDQADALLRLLNHLGIKSLRGIAGGSYGGMVALAFAERFPDRVSQLIVIGASDAPHPLATGWRSTQRQIVRFAVQSGRASEGLAIARGLAMCTYRSPQELAARFRGSPAVENGRLTAPIERYLAARGADYAAKYRAESFLCLSESIDLHRVDATRVFTPAVIVAVEEDQLVPIDDIRAMTARLPAARLRVISSLYGHDAFLKESAVLRGIFAESLQERN